MDEGISIEKMAAIQTELQEMLHKILIKHFSTDEIISITQHCSIAYLSIKNLREILGCFIGITMEESFKSIIRFNSHHDKQKYNPNNTLGAIYSQAHRIMIILLWKISIFIRSIY